ncbi:DUF1540 domain-containing protein [Clostridium uliginosum]|uniref:DUF1540 domain-containing protein n=1 Tax=Clostridium uliginosum TaxID=119641 RepID=A0A1I1QW44_9CLOT|nr:DUF1540 domain-containing protein [Clostridium uliginosum]SFD22270.1 protein of unknown function [Clostridium uliginosum]
MTKLNCSARNCANNQQGMCGAGYIMIEGAEAQSSLQTYCSNYREGSSTYEAQSMAGNGYMASLMQAFSSIDNVGMNPDVNCHATNCFYNLNGKCEARNVSILMDSSQGELNAKCQTFVR